MPPALAYDRDDFQPGDLLAFSGRGVFSSIIRAATCSPYSHIGICASVVSQTGIVDGFAQHVRQVLLFESTTLADLECELCHRHVEGVQAHTPSKRIDAYDGHVWRLRLAPMWRLDESESERLADFLIQFIGLPYDMQGALLSRVREIADLTPQQYRKLFCSELVAAGLQRLNRFPIMQSQRWTPGHLVRACLALGMYLHPEKLR